jgi:hypothetical protein
MSITGKTIGRSIVGGILACCLTLKVNAQPAPPTYTGPTNPAPSPAQIAAEQAAIAAAQQANYSNNYAPWATRAVSMPNGSQLTANAIQIQSSNALLNLSSSLSAVHTQEQTDVANYVATNLIGMPAHWTSTNGALYAIDHLDHGVPVIKQTCNIESAQTVGAQKLWPGGSTGFNITGSNVLMAQWDGGDLLTTHVEFTTNSHRASLLDGPSGYGVQDHPTHVAGTMTAWGVNAQAKGFSNRGKVVESVFYNSLDLVEMPLQAATNNVKESNHSYGYTDGWFIYTQGGVNYWFWYGDSTISTNWDWHFGFYNNISQTNDEIIYTAQTYLPVFAAGNENDTNADGPATQPFGHYELSNNIVVISSAIRPLNNAQGGYNTLTAYAVSKNNLVVGAVGSNTNGYTGTNSVSIAYFSSLGATADGRIRPDVVADGVNVYSSFSESNNAYGLDSGTSMATPAVTGTLGLLTSFYNQLYPTDAPLLSGATAPLASTLKGLLIHTADQLGNTIGPSYKYGWGLIDPVAAATLITNNYAAGSLPYVKEVRLVSGDYVQFPVVLTNNKPFKVTIVWTDPPGTPTAPALFPTNHMLVNDLDLRVISASGVTNYPWVLNRNYPTNAATTGDNNLDNVEQVSIPNPTSGTYQVRVTHKGNLLNDQRQVSYQNVSVLLSGNVPLRPTYPDINSIAWIGVSNLTALKWTSDVGRVYRVLYNNSLTSTNWQWASGELSATKTNTVFAVPFSGAQDQFYIVSQVR